MKVKAPRLVPLATQGIDLPRALKPFTGHSEYIFLCLFSRAKPLSKNTMLYGLVRLGYRGRMTVHGFRPMASRLLNENGHHPDVIGSAPAHVRGDLRSIYNRAKCLQERVRLYQWWADYVDAVRLSGGMHSGRVIDRALS